MCCDNGVICWRVYVPSGTCVSVWWRIYTRCSTTIPGSFRRLRCHIVMQCSSWCRNSRKPVPCVTLPDLESHQYWQRRKCWISQTACSKVRRSPSGNYPSRLVSHMAWPIQHQKMPTLTPLQNYSCAWIETWWQCSAGGILQVVFRLSWRWRRGHSGCHVLHRWVILPFVGVHQQSKLMCLVCTQSPRVPQVATAWWEDWCLGWNVT